MQPPLAKKRKLKVRPESSSLAASEQPQSLLRPLNNARPPSLPPPPLTLGPRQPPRGNTVLASSSSGFNLPPPTLILPLPFMVPVPIPIPVLIPIPQDKYNISEPGLARPTSRPGSVPNNEVGQQQSEVMSDCSDDVILDEQRRRRRALIIDKPSHTDR